MLIIISLFYLLLLYVINMTLNWLVIYLVIYCFTIDPLLRHFTGRMSNRYTIVYSIVTYINIILQYWFIGGHLSDCCADDNVTNDRHWLATFISNQYQQTPISIFSFYSHQSRYNRSFPIWDEKNLICNQYAYAYN